MAAAAAVAHKRAKEKRLKDQHDKREAQLDKWFERFDTDQSGDMDRTQISALFESIEPGYAVPESVMTSIMALGDNPDTVPREKVILAVKKFKAEVKYAKELQETFDKFDTDKSGSLDVSQLKACLEEAAHRAGYLYMKADDADVAHVLATADKSNTNTILIEELKPALATWLEVAEERKAEAAKSGCCSVL